MNTKIITRITCLNYIITVEYYISPHISYQSLCNYAYFISTFYFSTLDANPEVTTELQVSVHSIVLLNNNVKSLDRALLIALAIF